MKKLLWALLSVAIVSCNFHDKRKNDAIEALTRANQSLSPNHADSSAVRDNQSHPSNHPDSSAVRNNQSHPSNHPDISAVTQARAAVEAFVRRFPEDSLSPSFLFELALIYEKQRRYDSTIKTLDRIYSQYPRSKQSSKALFLEGFLYANVLHQLDKAKEKYELYLKQYSAADTRMTNDVQMELKNLGKSPEEILNEIQEKAKQDSLQVHSPQ